MEEEPEVVRAQGDVNDAVELSVRRRPPVAYSKRSGARCFAFKGGADIGTGIPLPLPLCDESLALGDADVGIPLLASGTNVTARVRDPDRDNLVERIFQLP